MKKIVSVSLILLAWAGSVSAAGNLEEGRKQAYTCTGCHGIPGYINAYPTYHVPKIGGQNYEYLISALIGYRNNERTHPTMNAQAASLNDEMIDNVATYFVSLKDSSAASNKKHSADGDAIEGEKKSITCQACHGNDGNGVDPQYPRLAGQYADYLEHAMASYQNGKRTNIVMVGMMSALSEQDIKDLAAFYSSKDGLIDLKIK